MRAGRVAERSVVVVRADPVRIHPVEHVRDVFVAAESVEQVQTVRRVAEHQRTRRNRLRRIPDELFKDVVRLVRIEHLYAEIAVVEETQPRVLRAVRHGFVFRAATLRIESHRNHRSRGGIRPTHRTVFGVVFNVPRSRGSLNRSHVPVGIVARIKRKRFEKTIAVCKIINLHQPYMSPPCNSFFLFYFVAGIYQKLPVNVIMTDSGKSTATAAATAQLV